MLTTEQQKKVVEAAKAKNPNITFEETKALLTRANSLNEQPKEGVKTFLKAAADATGISKSLANIGALGATGVGAVQMGLNKPEAAEKSFNTALGLRQYAGTEGSFDQGFKSGMTTLGKGSLEAGKTALTAYGLTAAPATLLKTAAVATPLGGVISKATGGTFSEGAGTGLGGTPSSVAVGKLITKAATPVMEKIKNISARDTAVDIANKITKTKDKLSVTKDISNQIDVLKNSPDAPKINYDLVKSKVESRAMTLPGKIRNAVLSNLDNEPSGSLTLSDAIDKKRGASFSINAKGATAKFNEIMREELAKEIHNVSPKLADLDNLYHVIKSGQNSKLVKKAISALIVSSAAGLGWTASTRK